VDTDSLAITVEKLGLPAHRGAPPPLTLCPQTGPDPNPPTSVKTAVEEILSPAADLWPLWAVLANRSHDPDAAGPFLPAWAADGGEELRQLAIQVPRNHRQVVLKAKLFLCR